MDNFEIYNDIARRTDGDIYIAVVGPVRTGKSTFIKRFMDHMVIPNIENIYKKERAKDELPQSGSGKTIMTTEPKFVPEDAAEISMDDGGSCRIRLVDCVGYLVESAVGHLEDEFPRMVSTPWSDEPMEFHKAAEIGTHKVITEHSTIGIVLTTDGTITDIDSEEYTPAHDRVISELLAISKPFIVLVNSLFPYSEKALEVCRKITETHGVPCTAVNCMEMEKDDIQNIIQSVLQEFPVTEIGIMLPKWVNILPARHDMKSSIYKNIREIASEIKKMRDISSACARFRDISAISSVKTDKIDLGTGSAQIDMNIPNELYYKIIGEEAGIEISDEAELLPVLTELAQIKRDYEHISGALKQVEQTGYGIVMPRIEELSLEEPEIVKQGGRFGVKLRASAPSIHMIRANIETEVSPIVGSEKQSEELIHYLLSEFDSEPGKIWESNIFGKSLHDLVSEGLNNKLNRMPEEARFKLQETLQRIINEGDGIIITLIF